jgi:hypothetical protein
MEKTRAVWASVRPRESRTGRKKTVNPRKKMPLAKKVIAEEEATTHQP